MSGSTAAQRTGGTSGGLDHDAARTRKGELVALARELEGRRVRAAGAPDATPARPAVAVGLTPHDDGSFGLAVRYRLGLPQVRAVARRLAEEGGPVVDVRRTGRIRPLDRPVGPRPPVGRAQALGPTDRTRPLRPGISIAHVDVSAGTLGAFVRIGGAVHALSNYHVLAGSPAAQVGDVVLQPGPADGGSAPDDRVGTLAATVPLAPGRTALVDAAVALLDDPEAIDPTYPVGRITRTGAVRGGEAVAKTGRTTALTRGRVTAIELDDVVVNYGEGLGDLAFDDQIEVESTGTGPFSRGGDSGSLVYLEDGTAIGLLFAGSETGGDNGTGLTYVNPIDAVLTALDATLV
ncbi:S1 family peptidase [Cellulomonas endophytica]|uniref:S1 family peptidase n=1 Tax=Cellulomonas endophytica TaxID=2494735 RepID=UPI001F0C4CE9|nr:S1 family peptidase [Cellulomonas endophytica]